MTVVVDTSVLIDVLRGRPEALELSLAQHAQAQLHASEMTRVEVMSGMRPSEDRPTRLLLATLAWHPVDEAVSEEAGALGRTWLRSHSGIDNGDLIIAATVLLLDATLLTRNVKHFPMFPGLVAPY